MGDHWSPAKREFVTKRTTDSRPYNLKILTNCLSKNENYQTMFVIELAFNIHFHNDVVENGRINYFAIVV